MGPPLADDLYNPEFAVVLRGYDPEEVRAYVQNVATHIEALQRQLRDARDQVEAGADRARSEAERVAHLTRREAESQADQMRREGEETLWRARAETERIL